MKNLKEKEYQTALEETLYYISHQIRKPVANLSGLIETVGIDISVNGLKKTCFYFKASTKELDDAVNELIIFIENPEIKVYSAN